MIPERFPAADGDIYMSGLIDAGIAHFTGNLDMVFSHRLDEERRRKPG